MKIKATGSGLLHIKTRGAQGDRQLQDLIPISFFPFKIKAVKDCKENKENGFSCLAAACTGSPEGICSGVEFQEGGEEESWLHHLSMLLLPLDQVSRAALSSGWQKGEKNNKEAGTPFCNGEEDSNLQSYPLPVAFYIKKNPFLVKQKQKQNKNQTPILNRLWYTLNQ